MFSKKYFSVLSVEQHFKNVKKYIMYFYFNDVVSVQFHGMTVTGNNSPYIIEITHGSQVLYIHDC